MKIYIDMDGVLCNWTKSIMGTSYPTRKYISNYYARKYINENEIKAKMSDINFWANLEKYDYADSLVSLCESLGEVQILTKRAKDHPISSDGKRLWMARHFPKLEPDMIIVDFRKADRIDELGFLVDDNESQMKFWNRKGYPGFRWQETTGECDGDIGEFNKRQLLDLESNIKQAILLQQSLAHSSLNAHES